MNEISVPNFLYCLVTSILFFFLPAIVNIMANFKRSNFASSAVRNPSLQENRTMVQLTVSMGIDFTERCHVLFNPVVESLLCSLHDHSLLLCKSYLLESQ